MYNIYFYIYMDDKLILLYYVNININHLINNHHIMDIFNILYNIINYLYLN